MISSQTQSMLLKKFSLIIESKNSGFVKFKKNAHLRNCLLTFCHRHHPHDYGDDHFSHLCNICKRLYFRSMSNAGVVFFWQIEQLSLFGAAERMDRGEGRKGVGWGEEDDEEERNNFINVFLQSNQAKSWLSHVNRPAKEQKVQNGSLSDRSKWRHQRHL